MKTGLFGISNHIRAIILGIFCISILWNQNCTAMDADNSIEIASCIKRTGFEKDGARALAVLREHKIQAELTYLQNQRGVKAITENPKQSTEWVIAVNSKDAAEARKLLAAAIKDGLKVVLIGEQKGSKAK